MSQELKDFIASWLDVIVDLLKLAGLNDIADKIAAAL